MRAFDRIDPTMLDRRELHLWLLAITVMLVMAIGMALLMYPTAFSEPVVLTDPTLRKTFFGFCVLSVLLAGYFLDRQLTIRQLRKRLFEEQRRVAKLRHEASAELLESLPGFGHFQDRIAMEFRRASHTQEPLSLLVVQLKPARELSEPVEITSAFGDGAKALVHTLRREDSIYQFRPGVFGILLPGVSATDAYHVLDRIADRLQAASGAGECFSFDARIVNYPEHIATAREMEKAVVSFLPENQPARHAA
jgi:GGDEF domain-containing protein